MSTHGIFQMDCISVCICLYLIMSTRKMILSVNNLNLLYFCLNQQWKSFLFSTWHTKFHQYFKSLSILSPIPQESLSANLTFFRRFLLVLNSNYFQLWLRSTNVLQAHWDRPPAQGKGGRSPGHGWEPVFVWMRLLEALLNDSGQSLSQRTLDFWFVCLRQQQWWALPHLLQARSARLV